MPITRQGFVTDERERFSPSRSSARANQRLVDIQPSSQAGAIGTAVGGGLQGLSGTLANLAGQANQRELGHRELDIREGRANALNRLNMAQARQINTQIETDLISYYLTRMSDPNTPMAYRVAFGKAAASKVGLRNAPIKEGFAAVETGMQTLNRKYSKFFDDPSTPPQVLNQMANEYNKDLGKLIDDNPHVPVQSRGHRQLLGLQVKQKYGALIQNALRILDDPVETAKFLGNPDKVVFHWENIRAANDALRARNEDVPANAILAEVRMEELMGINRKKLLPSDLVALDQASTERARVTASLKERVAHIDQLTPILNSRAANIAVNATELFETDKELVDLGGVQKAVEEVVTPENRVLQNRIQTRQRELLRQAGLTPQTRLQLESQLTAIEDRLSQAKSGTDSRVTQAAASGGSAKLPQRQQELTNKAIAAIRSLRNFITSDAPLSSIAAAAQSVTDLTNDINQMREEMQTDFDRGTALDTQIDKFYRISQEPGKRTIQKVQVTLPDGTPADASVIQDPNNLTGVAPVLNVQTPQGTFPAIAEKQPLVTITESAAERRDRVEREAAVSQLDVIQDDFDPSFVGLLDKRLGGIREATGFSSERESRFRANVNRYQIEQQNRIFGSALSVQEKTDALKAIPNLGMNDAQFRAAVDASKGWELAILEKQAEALGAQQKQQKSIASRFHELREQFPDMDKGELFKKMLDEGF